MENEIWERFKDGNQIAFRLLYEKYSSLLYVYGMKIACDRELVNDCISELFIYLYEKRRTISTPINIKAYLMVALKRRIQAQMKKTSKENSRIIRLDNYGSFNLIIDMKETMENTDLKEEQLVALQKAIMCLTSRQREVLYLRYYKNMSVSEVAEIVGICKQAVMNVSSLALSRLRDNEYLIKSLLFGFYLFLQNLD